MRVAASTKRALLLVLVPFLIAIASWRVAVWATYAVPPIERLALWGVADRVSSRPPRLPDQRLIVAEITSETEARLGLEAGQVVPRRFHADLVRALRKGGAVGVAFDLSFTVPRAGDNEFAAAIREASTPKIGFSVADTDRSEDDREPDGMRLEWERTILFEGTDWPAHAVESSQLYLPGENDDDVIGAVMIRSHPRWGDRFPALSLLVASMLDGVDWEEVERIGDRRVRIGSRELPIGLSSEVLIENIDVQGLRRVPYHELLDVGETPGSVVLVGDARESSRDIVRLPSGEVVPGVVAHAALVQSILYWTGRDLESSSRIQDSAAILAGWLAVLATTMRRRGLSLLLGVAVVALVAALPRLMSQFGVFIEETTPALSSLFALTTGFAVRGSGFKPWQRAAGDTREATVLFVDLVSSTVITRTLGGVQFQELHRDLNAVLAQAVETHGGEVERTLGDGLVAIFPSVGETPHPLRALTCAEEMLERVSLIEGKYADRAGVPIRVTIGIESGLISGGYVREGGHLAWSSSAASLILAQRVQSAAGQFEESLLIGPTAAAMIRDVRPLSLVGEFHPKGFDEPINVYRI